LVNEREIKRRNGKLKALNPSNYLTNSRHHNWHPIIPYPFLRNFWDNMCLALPPKERQLISFILRQKRYHLPEATNVVAVNLLEELDQENL